MVALAVLLPALLFLIIVGIIGFFSKHHKEKETLSLEEDFENKEEEIARKELGKEHVGKEEECPMKGKKNQRVVAVLQRAWGTEDRGDSSQLGVLCPRH